jgi:hypothetical protein
MTDNLKISAGELDKDLSPSWIELSDKVRNLSKDLKLKTAGSEYSSEAEHLAQQAARLCDHVEKLHSDVIDLVENIENRVPLHEIGGSAESGTGSKDADNVEKEKIQVQRESHELRSDFKDVLKALFMWVDDPEERVKDKK